jgi:hypothetical protein
MINKNKHYYGNSRKNDNWRRVALPTDPLHHFSSRQVSAKICGICGKNQKKFLQISQINADLKQNIITGKINPLKIILFL